MPLEYLLFSLISLFLSFQLLNRLINLFQLDHPLHVIALFDLSLNPFPFIVPKLDRSNKIEHHVGHVQPNHRQIDSDETLTHLVLEQWVYSQVYKIGEAKKMEAQDLNNPFIENLKSVLCSDLVWIYMTYVYDVKYVCHVDKLNLEVGVIHQDEGD